MGKIKNVILIGLVQSVVVSSFAVPAYAKSTDDIIKVEAEDYIEFNGNVTVREDGEEIPTAASDENYIYESIKLENASGGKFLDFSNPVKEYNDKSSALQNSVGISDNVAWKVNAPKAGIYEIKFRYNNPGTRWDGYRNARDERNCRVLINGSEQNLNSDKGWAGWVIFSVSGHNTTGSAVTTKDNAATHNEENVSGNTAWNDNYLHVYLKEGENEITLAMQAPPGQAVYDGPNLDCFELKYVENQYISKDSIPKFEGQFNHPGIYYTMADLENIKKNKDIEGSVWNDGYTQLINSELSSSDYMRKNDAKNYDPETGTMFWKIVERGPYNNPDKGSTPFSKDGLAAHYNMLRWYIDGDVNNAKKAMELLNGWAATLEGVINNDSKLIVAINAPAYINAAELLKHVYNNDSTVKDQDKWSQNDMDKFESFVKKLYVVIEEYYPQANGNWDALMSAANMSIGVYLDDKYIFNRALQQYTRGDVVPGTVSMGALPNDIYENGENAESNRDQVHAGMGIDGLCHSAEIAWNQNINLFKCYDNRLVKGVLYSLQYNYLNENVESNTFISDKKRGGMYISGFDIIANYYKNYDKSVLSDSELELLENGSKDLRKYQTDEGSNKSGFVNAMIYIEDKEMENTQTLDYSKLNTAISKAEDKLNSKISKTSKQTLKQLISECESMKSNVECSQIDIDNMAKKLEDLTNSIKILSSSSSSHSSSSESATESNNSEFVDQSSDNNITNTNSDFTGWKKDVNNNWIYYNNEKAVTGWNKIDNSWYLFDLNGVMKTGWNKDGENWYYLKDNGSMQTGWIYNNDKWYYLNENGSMHSGWINLSNKWYYLNEDGDIYSGWKHVNGQWYYLYTVVQWHVIQKLMDIN